MKWQKVCQVVQVLAGIIPMFLIVPGLPAQQMVSAKAIEAYHTSFLPLNTGKTEIIASLSALWSFLHFQ